MVQLYWHSLVPDREAFCRDSLEQLQAKLKERYPQLPGLCFEQVSAEEVQYIGRSETYQRAGFLDSSSPNSLHAKRLVVMCQGNEPFAKRAREKNTNAKWGAAQIGEYALIWEPDNKYLFWHETLHVVGAKDSYDEQSLQTVCEDDRCIMQYVPNETNCGGELFICENNIALLKANG